MNSVQASLKNGNWDKFEKIKQWLKILNPRYPPSKGISVSHDSGE